jgi:hypothetical protein
MDQPDRLDPALVEAFVGKCHGDFKAIQDMLSETPALINACWDWGGGDWETGLGAAAHMGRRDIAEFLLAQGARIDLFAAAMLGQLEIVKAILAFDPGAAKHAGPHGIPLLVHAKAGGEPAQAVVDYLEGLLVAA